MELSFGEQIKILLSRNHMTIQDLADRYEAATGNKMSRQNLTQRLKRDNFPEQDMHVFASLLGHRVSIQLEPTVHVTFPQYSGCPAAAETMSSAVAAKIPPSPDELSDQTFFDEEVILEPLEFLQESPVLSPEEPDIPADIPEDIPKNVSDLPEEPSAQDPSDLLFEIPAVFRRQKPEGDINPLTGEEYMTNTVRKHPDDPDFIQVYDRKTHSWSDVAEDYFWDFQQKKKQMLGSDYQEPLVI